MIFHQNIRGFKGKTEEIMNNIAINPPHVLCFTEHHLESHQLDCVPLQSYRLVVKFCSITYRYGRVCIYVHESLQASNMEVLKYCKKKDLEVCSARLYLLTCTIGIVNLYSSPLGNFDYFLKELEILLNLVSRNSRGLIICGDFNINFMEDTTHKRILNSLLATFGLYPTVDFPTRIYNNSITTIDNIFINTVNQNTLVFFPVLMVYRIMMCRLLSCMTLQ
jgi:exonuclease III